MGLTVIKLVCWALRADPLPVARSTSSGVSSRAPRRPSTRFSFPLCIGFSFWRLLGHPAVHFFLFRFCTRFAGSAFNKLSWSNGVYRSRSDASPISSYTTLQRTMPCRSTICFARCKAMCWQHLDGMMKQRRRFRRLWSALAPYRKSAFYSGSWQCCRSNVTLRNLDPDLV
jgi:hypothetical protein